MGRFPVPFDVLAGRGPRRAGRETGDLRDPGDGFLGEAGVGEEAPGFLRRLPLRQIHPAAAASTVTMLTQVSQLVNIWPAVYCQVRLSGMESGNSVSPDVPIRHVHNDLRRQLQAGVRMRRIDKPRPK